MLSSTEMKIRSGRPRRVLATTAATVTCGHRHRHHRRSHHGHRLIATVVATAATTTAAAGALLRDVDAQRAALEVLTAQLVERLLGASAAAISTKQKPRDWPVIRSSMSLTFLTSPQVAKRCWTRSSVA